MQGNKWEKSKPWVWQLLMIGAIIAIGWFGIQPFLKTILEKMDSIQKLSVTRDHREKQLERLPELEAEHALIQERSKELDIILEKERLVDFIEQLEALAITNGVEIEILSRDNAFLESKVTAIEKKSGSKGGDKNEEVISQPKKGAVKETGILTELPFEKFLKLTITLKGEYQAIVQYLHQLETMPFALDVIGINIKEQSEVADRVVLDSGVLNPFAPGDIVVARPAVISIPILEAVFETVVYTKD